MTIKAPQFSSNPFLRFGAESPFAPTVPATDEVSDAAPEGSYSYAMVPSGPALASDECETENAAIEIVVSWGASVMHVAHLSPAREFVVGEESADVKVDFLMPAEKVGASRLAIVAMKDGAPHLVVPAGATGTMTRPGQPVRSLTAGESIALASETKARVELGGLVFEVGAVKAGRKVAGKLSMDTKSLPWTGLSAVLHIGVLAATAFFMPPSALADEEGITDAQRYNLMQAMDAVAEHEQDHQADLQSLDKAGEQQGGTGARAVGEEGKMGSEVSKNTNGRWGNKGPKENPDPHVSRAEMMNDAQNGFMIGLLNSGLGGDKNAPIATWGREDSLGNDPLSAKGNMWGTDIAESNGLGGLGLSGIGEGSGGLGFGIGLGKLGLGHGAGDGDGQGFGNCKGEHCNGFGGRNLLASTHHVGTPSMRVGTTTASGRLPPEVIQRIVRQNFGRFRGCYESALRNNPNLQGRVAVRFVIGHDGAVQSAANGGSDLPDAGVVSCVTRAFYGLSFPQPDGGIVTVTYPIAFAPAGS